MTLNARSSLISQKATLINQVCMVNARSDVSMIRLAEHMHACLFTVTEYMHACLFTVTEHMHARLYNVTEHMHTYLFTAC